MAMLNAKIGSANNRGTGDMLNSDDRLNIIILIAALAFLAYAVPARLQENRDANSWAALRALARP